ncbi:MAG TPA: aldehyde dehydrogenase family protein, partial [Fimbriimonadaceae bacterium]|nr:aldehyde dehydrogenase family protein [Fimbriimonadaceae bacterium]
VHYGCEALPVDYDPRGSGYTCRVERFPIGVVFGIVPYNWPYNLAAHKLAPALAVGNTVVLKPSSTACLSTLTLARIIQEAGCPAGVVNAVPCPSSIVEKALNDPRIAMLSFTGSPPVGWKLKGLLPEKRVSLELGGDASAIVAPDADLDWATTRIVQGAYGYAGQICIAIQHVLVHESIYTDMRERLVRATTECSWGDPELEETVCGPVINSDAADKVEAWRDEAVAAGAVVIAGGERRGNTVQPTLLEGVPCSVKLANEEVFGPLLTLAPYRDLDEALARVNSSDYGIQAGIFTRDLSVAERAFRELEVGGVIVNDYPTLRFDSMPYGGVKRSGFGREGVRYAMDEMTELKTLVVRTAPEP